VAARPDARPATAGAPAATGEAVLLSRGEVDAALADFARLTAAIHGSFSAAGVVVDAVRDGTLFQRAGLRAGDVIAAVDGIRLRSLDDAANVYARASKATAITAQIVRSGKPMTLHVAIR
jgi:S1-C subfamily serine protease